MEPQATVTPKSSKAKNRFANLMGSDGTCIIEQVKGDMLFLRSANKRNFFWIHVKNDPHWMLN